MMCCWSAAPPTAQATSRPTSNRSPKTLERGRPDLSGHRYGMIALGDMTYQDTFCGGGKKVDRVFELCGARRLGDRLEVDASSQPLPDEEALSWVEDWKVLV